MWLSHNLICVNHLFARATASATLAISLLLSLPFLYPSRAHHLHPKIKPLTATAVSWKWGGGRPSGTVAEIATEGSLSIQSNKGNTIKKNADPEDPAVHVAREGNDVVKRAHELTVEKKADGGSKTDAKEEKEKPHDSKHEAKAGDKRKADAVDGAQNGDKADDKKKATPKKHDESPTKKQKKKSELCTNSPRQRQLDQWRILT